MTPLTDIMGFDLAVPRLWPMGIARPRAVECVIGTPWRYRFDWDDRDRLVAVRAAIGTGAELSRDEYRWTADRLDRIVHFDAALGDDHEYERIWTWEHGVPTAVRTALFEDEADGPDEAWVWSGETVRITESSSRGVNELRTATFDAGRLVHLEVERPIDRMRRVVDATWVGGRIVEAREVRDGIARVVTFRWEGDRLAAQTNDLHAGDLWVYR